MSAQLKFIKESPGLRAQEARPDLEEHRRRVAEAAYYRAERRGFESGHEEEDWLEAEREIGDDAGAEPVSPPAAAEAL